MELTEPVSRSSMLLGLDLPGLDRMYDRAETQRARKLEQRLDQDERKRHDTMEHQREAETRSEEHRALHG